jgi:hypothetical protein
VLDECIGVGSIRFVAARIRRDVPVFRSATRKSERRGTKSGGDELTAANDASGTMPARHNGHRHTLAAPDGKGSALPPQLRPMAHDRRCHQRDPIK